MGWLLRRFFKLWVRAAVQPAEAPPALTEPRVPVCYVLERDSMADLAVLCNVTSKARLPYPEKRSSSLPVEAAPLLLRRGPPAPLLGRHADAPAAAVPAGAGRSAERRFRARHPARAHRGVLGPRAAERGLVAAPAVRGELGADDARAQVLCSARQRPQRHGGDGRAHQPALAARRRAGRTTRRGA